MDLTPRCRVFNFNTQEDYTNFIESFSKITQLLDERYDCLSNVIYDMLFDLVKKFHSQTIFEYKIIQIKKEELLIIDNYFNKMFFKFQFDIKHIKVIINDSNKYFLYLRFDEKLQKFIINEDISYYHD